MKLFLSSLSPPNKQELLKLLGKKQNLTVAIIPNAWDTYSEERKEVEVGNYLRIFKEYGFQTTILDLTTATSHSILSVLKGKDLVWVMGGNTFYLNYYMQISGFSELIKELLQEGLVYGGESAGAVVAGRTLHGIEHLDDPKDSPEIRWDGLGLLDSGIIPHWGLDKYGDSLEKAKTEMDEHARVVTINNEDALLIDTGRSMMVRNIPT